MQLFSSNTLMMTSFRAVFNWSSGISSVEPWASTATKLINYSENNAEKGQTLSLWTLT